MSVRDELVELMRVSNGLLTVEAAYDWAVANPESDLYKSLEWDDEKAGLQYRFWQIRRLIAVHVRYEEQPELRQIVSLSADRINRSGGGYRDLNHILATQSLHEMLLADALRELQRLEDKYKMLSALKPVWQAAGKARQKAKKKGGVAKRRA